MAQSVMVTCVASCHEKITGTGDSGLLPAMLSVHCILEEGVQGARD